jgi:hypothetical protein
MLCLSSQRGVDSVHRRGAEARFRTADAAYGFDCAGERDSNCGTQDLRQRKPALVVRIARRGLDL